VSLLTYQQAYNFNQWIDGWHNPSFWILGGIVGIVAILESFLPAKNFISGYYEKILINSKFFFLIALAVVFFTQGLLGGCIIQLPQNWIAQNFLGRPFWYPFGLVYREGISEQYWPLLRFFYLILGTFAIQRCLVFYKKFVNLKMIKN
jgi:hypothetical protein